MNPLTTEDTSPSKKTSTSSCSLPWREEEISIGFLNTLWIVFKKDLLIEFRTRSCSTAMVVLVGLLAAVLGMSFEALADHPRVVSGVMWVLITFAALHGLSRSFDADFREGALQGLLLTGAEPSAIYLGKVLSNTLFLLMVSILAGGMTIMFFGASDLLSVFPKLILLMALAALGLSAVGGILTVISRHSSLGETLLPLLFLPLVVPILLAGVESVPLLIQTGSLEAGWLRVLLVYSLGMTVATTLLFEHTVEG